MHFPSLGSLSLGKCLACLNPCSQLCSRMLLPSPMDHRSNSARRAGGSCMPPVCTRSTVRKCTTHSCKRLGPHNTFKRPFGQNVCTNSPSKWILWVIVVLFHGGSRRRPACIP